jgi:hypothetical protein
MLCAPVLARAQVCLGTPAGIAVAYEFGSRTVGKANGAAASLARGRTAWGLSYRHHDVQQDLTGHEGELRFSLVFPAKRLMLCPTLKLGAQRDTWNVTDDMTLKSNRLTIGVGGAAGLQQRLFWDYLHIIPFLAIRYEFNAIAHQLDVAESENEITPDTISGMAFEYGVLVKFHGFHVGRVLHRRAGDGSTHFGRFVMGYSWGAKPSPASPLQVALPANKDQR